MKEFIEKLIGRLEELNLDGIRMIEDGKYELIRKKEAISIVNELTEEYNTSTDTSRECNKALDSLHKKILKSRFAEEVTEAEVKALVEAKSNGWIPCSERLPQESEPVGTLCQVVNVMLKNGIVTSGWCNRYLEKWYVLDHHCDYPLPYEYKDVIAWQPLPASYKEGE